MKIHKPKLPKEIQIKGSKSETNRLLILQKVLGAIEILNPSSSQDTELLKSALASQNKIIDVHNAGTAMRFLTSFFATQEGRETLLTGSERMKQRPISPLVEALQELGADIQYLERAGFPPLKIKGKKIEKSSVRIPAGISSQFITSLILIGGSLASGLMIELVGEITSRPYLEMTLKILKTLYPNAPISFQGQKIFIPYLLNAKPSQSSFIVESDWSSASYFYSFAAIGRREIKLSNFKRDSLQGDAVVSKIYRNFFGVETVFNDNEHSLSLIPKADFSRPTEIHLDMNDCPDIAQTVCVTAAAMQIPFTIEGLATLKIKETDRLLALHNELKKLGCHTETSHCSIKTLHYTKPELPISIKTYDDHRMAMSFAPYSLLQEIEIQNPEVVKKSYPEFWKDLGI